MFESGEHVLVSCKQTGIRISRLWLGMVPIRKVCDWPRSNPRGLEGAVGILVVAMPRSGGGSDDA